jgi:hypothetical protein
MSVRGKVSHDLLLDSEESLRIADSLVAELCDHVSPAAEALGLRLEMSAGAIDLPQILLRAHAEISQVLESLRRSRGILERTTMERVRRTQAKLREVSAETENAAIGMLDGLDRSLEIVDRLDDDSERRLRADEAATLRSELRDRLNGLIIALQFQDITAQQLSYASAVLEDLEGRMAAVAALIDQNLVGLEPVDGDQPVMELLPNQPRSFDSDASTIGAETRQAIADEIFIKR